MTIEVSGDLSNETIRELQEAVLALEQGGGGSGNEIVSQSIVSGTVTAPGSSVAAEDAHYGSSPSYLYSGGITGQAGNITGSDPAAGMYLYGGRVTFNGGDVTISGNASVASRMAGGKVIIIGGTATCDSGEQPDRLRGGTFSIGGGAAVEDGVGTASGASIGLDGGGVNVSGKSGGALDLVAGSTTFAGADGGRLFLRAGSGGAGGLNGEVMIVDADQNRVVQVGPTVGTLGFFGQTPAAQGAAIANATDGPSAIARLNDLLAYLRSRGDIAT